MSLKLWARAGLAAAAFLLAALPAAADPGFFFGHWANVHPDTDNITKVIIQPGAGGIKVRAFGQCHPTDCDWGVTDGHYENGFLDEKIKAEFNSGFSITRLVMHRAAGGDLEYDAHTHFTDGSGRAPYDVHGHFYRVSGYGGYGGGGGPPPGPPPGPSMGAEDCNAFNPATVTASFVGGEWKVVDGGSWMLSYGGNAPAAHHAADIIHHYHFDRQCFGQPRPAMMYWKKGNHVPSGNTPGQDCIGLNPDHAMAAHLGGSWKVVADGNSLLDFGGNHAGADQAVAVIQAYRLNRQCFIERPNPSMMYWLSQ
ncbi:MAG TPA: hypothetical protein VMH86_04805 [Rhizomicrobium sp.]|nr:hypothetical protein [Rhizomicrobium sp.]